MANGVSILVINYWGATPFSGAKEVLDYQGFDTTYYQYSFCFIFQLFPSFR